MTTLRIGVFGIQGDIEEHVKAVNSAMEQEKLHGETMLVKTPEAVEIVDGVIIPGGESTVIGSLSSINGTLGRLEERIVKGLPVLGTCAGAILLSREAEDRVIGRTRQKLLGVLDATVKRNAFGRQRESFEEAVSIPKLGAEPFPAVFIRAPIISSVGEQVEVLSRVKEGIVAVQQRNILATSFHPELSRDLIFHKYFLSLVLSNK
ncbi:MAG: pyridoxal 5'-phosphate synthase glutaminase subunit PdxT [Conexivisphaerales archaeon]